MDCVLVYQLQYNFVLCCVYVGRNESTAELFVTFHECMHRHVGEV